MAVDSLLMREVGVAVPFIDKSHKAKRAKHGKLSFEHSSIRCIMVVRLSQDYDLSFYFELPLLLWSNICKEYASLFRLWFIRMLNDLQLSKEALGILYYDYCSSNECMVLRHQFFSDHFNRYQVPLLRWLPQHYIKAVFKNQQPSHWNSRTNPKQSFSNKIKESSK